MEVVGLSSLLDADRPSIPTVTALELHCPDRSYVVILLVCSSSTLWISMTTTYVSIAWLCATRVLRDVGAEIGVRLKRLSVRGRSVRNLVGGSVVIQACSVCTQMLRSM